MENHVFLQKADIGLVTFIYSLQAGAKSRFLRNKQKKPNFLVSTKFASLHGITLHFVCILRAKGYNIHRGGSLISMILYICTYQEFEKKISIC